MNLKYKKGGYVLLLTMMLISSAFFLAISVFVKNKMANRAIRLFYDKHEENIFFANAIAIVQGILQGEGSLFEKNKKKNSSRKFIFVLVLVAW